MPLTELQPLAAVIVKTAWGRSGSILQHIIVAAYTILYPMSRLVLIAYNVYYMPKISHYMQKLAAA